MNRYDLKLMLTTSAAAACLALGVGMPAAGAHDTLTFDSDKAVAASDNSTVQNNVPPNAANGNVGTDTATNLPGQSGGTVNYCLGILFRAQCADATSGNGGSTPGGNGGSTPVTPVVPVTPAPG